MTKIYSSDDEPKLIERKPRLMVRGKKEALSCTLDKDTIIEHRDHFKVMDLFNGRKLSNAYVEIDSVYGKFDMEMHYEKING